MAGGSLFALLDDIATLLDDIAVLSKVAVHKTAGVLGDDLALNAQQVTGLNADRELPVVWSVAKGSLANKAILVPSAIFISFFAPWAVIPLLVIGGIYLCFEGVEKILHHWLHKEEEDQHLKELHDAVVDEKVDLVQLEKERIQGAIRTDFVLSAEIIVITLGAVAKSPFVTQVGVLVAISIIMTVGVYGLVAGIVKLDDLGIYLSKSQGNGTFQGVKRSTGRMLLGLAPFLLRSLSIIGTVAMFTVGGGIIVHGFHSLEEGIHHLTASMLSGIPLATMIEFIVEAVLHALIGVLFGGVALAVVEVARKVISRSSVKFSK